MTHYYIYFLERNQPNSKVFCQTPMAYFLEFHREVYAIHFNDVYMPLQSTSIVTYADDTVIFTAAKDLESIQKHLS